MGFILGFLAGDIAILWAWSGRCTRLSGVVAEVEPDRLKATERLLVLLVVDVVYFVISCCKAIIVIEKFDKKKSFVQSRVYFAG